MSGVNRNARQGGGLTKPFTNLKSHVVKIILLLLRNIINFVIIVKNIIIIANLDNNVVMIDLISMSCDVET